MKKWPALFIFGPTASGKTDLACFLVEALKNKQIYSEIISVDSALVYQEMNIGTAKPSSSVLKRYPHYLIDCILPTDSFNAARFQKEALHYMNQIHQRGHLPILTGGTMLYFSTLLEGLNDLPSADLNLRENLHARAQKIGWPALHQELKKVDEPTALRLNPNDSQRIERALEVFYLTHKPLSAWLKQTTPSLPFEALCIGLCCERAQLHAKINHRFDHMLKNGLVEEVRALRQKYPLTAQMPSMRCVGYRQVWQALEGQLRWEELHEKGAAATRQLAKRQITWMNNRLKHEAFWTDSAQMPHKVLARVLRHWDDFA